MFGRSRAWGRPGWGSALPPWEAGRWWVPVNCLSFPFGLGLCPLTSLTEKLRRQLKETQRAAFAEGTHKNLLTQWKTFLVFCDRYQYEAMPVSKDMICLYAQYLANKLKSPQTVRNYIDGVRVLQVLVDQPIEAFRSPDLKLTFRGIARLRQHQPKRAQAITPEMLCRMHKFINVSDTVDLVVWAAILVTFFCMLRKSNYVPESQKSFDKSKQLCREDIAVGPDCLLVHIKWSKTIQLAERTLHIPILAIPNSPICPVNAFRQMVDKVPAGPDNPAFCVQAKQGLRPLTYRVFQARLKQLVHKLGWVAALVWLIRPKCQGNWLKFKGTGLVTHTWCTCPFPLSKESKWRPGSVKLQLKKGGMGVSTSVWGQILPAYH